MRSRTTARATCSPAAGEGSRVSDTSRPWPGGHRAPEPRDLP